MNAAKWTDPFQEMSDDELDEHVATLLTARPSAVAVSLRIAPDLLARVKRQAARAGLPYQAFINGLLEAGVGRLERGPSRSKGSRPRTSPPQ
jgi:predicted DNA binding CopG/RHH family protein